MKAIILSLLSVVSFAHATLEPLPRFDWTTLMVGPKENTNGHQILHFGSSDKPIENNPTALQFKETYLQDAVSCGSDAEVLKMASDAIQIKGTIIEVGTKAGKNANFLAALNPQQTIYSFDSAKGLPLDWERPDFSFPAGFFAYKNEKSAPPVLANVVLYRGDYSEMLSEFKHGPVSLLHVDCEIYESARNVLNALAERIIPGTIIVFDEAYNYPNSENHEWKAFLEFLKDQNLTYKPLTYNRLHEQVAVLITK